MPTLTEDPLAAARAELEQRIRAGESQCVEGLRETLDSESALELIYTEYVLRRDRGETPDPGSYAARFPEYQDRLERLFGLYDLLSTRETIPDTPASETAGLPRAFASTAPAEYEVLRELGRGGMAIVLLAVQTSLQRNVALKILKSGPWLTEAEDARIRREAATAAKLSHPNIVPIFEVGEWNDSPFLAFEYIPGGTLAEALAKKPKLRASEVAAFVAVLARAMHYAHEQGVIHRDLKPANILLTDGTLSHPKIADFGLSMAVDAAQSQSGIIGTPSYMAPEQAVGQRDGITPAADVYALGTILYEMLSGRPPFEGETVFATLEQVRSAVPRRWPDTPPELWHVVRKCLQKRPSARYASAEALAADLDRYTAGVPIAVAPSRRRFLKLGAAAGVVGIAAATVRYWPRSDASPVVAQPREPFPEAGKAYSELRSFGGPEYAGAELVISPDGQRLAWLDFLANKIHIQDVATGTIVDSIETGNHRQKLAFADADRLVILRQPHLPAAPLGHGRVRAILWVGNDSVTIRNVRTRTDSEPRNLPYHQAQIIHRGRLATCTTTKLTVTNLANGTLVSAFPNPLNLELQTAQPPAVLPPNAKKPLNSRYVGLAMNDHRILLHLEDKLHVWNLQPPGLVLAVRCPNNMMNDLAISPVGDRALGLRSLGADTIPTTISRSVYGWDLTSGEERFKVKYDDYAGAMVYLDNHRFAVSVGHTIQVHASQTGELLTTLRGHKGFVYRLAANGSRLYSTSADNTLREWDIAPPS